MSNDQAWSYTSGTAGLGAATTVVAALAALTGTNDSKKQIRVSDFQFRNGANANNVTLKDASTGTVIWAWPFAANELIYPSLDEAALTSFGDLQLVTSAIGLVANLQGFVR